MAIDDNARKRSTTRYVLREDIKEHLIDAILRGRYKPGDRLAEAKLAKEFGVSQSPIREALRDLEMMGLRRIGAVFRFLCPRPFAQRYVGYLCRTRLDGSDGGPIGHAQPDRRRIRAIGTASGTHDEAGAKQRLSRIRQSRLCLSSDDCRRCREQYAHSSLRYASIRLLDLRVNDINRLQPGLSSEATLQDPGCLKHGRPGSHHQGTARPYRRTHRQNHSTLYGKASAVGSQVGGKGGRTMTRQIIDLSMPGSRRHGGLSARGASGAAHV